MAVSELAANAVEHGKGTPGAYVAVERQLAPRRVSIAIADLGMGIPEHLRRVYPEYADDDFAIVQAMGEGVTGTGDRHRGNGFTQTFEAALTSTLHAARIEIHSGVGFIRREIVDGTITTQPFPAASRRRGTWISYDLVAAG